MKITINVFHHGSNDDEIKQQLNTIILKLNTMAKELDEITKEVSETKTVIDSAVALIKGIKAKLDEAGTDAVKLKALSDELSNKTDELATAVTENTPAAEDEG